MTQGDDEAERDLCSEIEELRCALASLREEFVTELEERRSAAMGRAGDVVDAVKDNICQAQERLREGLGEARTYGRQAIDEAHKKITERPVTSALVAFGVGLIIGKLIERR